MADDLLKKEGIDYDLIKGCGVPYMRIELSNTGEWVVVRPQLGSHKFPQKRFRKHQIGEAVEYLNRCLSNVSKLAVGGVARNTKKIETLGYYIEQFLKYRSGLKKYAEGTVRSYRDWLSRFSNCNAEMDGSVVSMRSLRCKKMEEVEKNYLSLIKGNTREAARQSAIKIYEEFCSDHHLEPRVIENAFGVVWIRQEIAVQVGLLVAAEIKEYYKNTYANRKITSITQEDIVNTLKKIGGCSAHYSAIALHELYKFMSNSKEHRHVLSDKDFDWQTKDLSTLFDYSTDKQIDFYSKEESEKIRAFYDSDDFKKLTNCEQICFLGFMILGQTGMRVGEMLAVNRADIETVKIVGGVKYLHIYKTVATRKTISDDGRSVDESFIKLSTKTNKVRSFALSESTYDLFKSVLAISKEMESESDYLFPVVNVRSSEKQFMERGTFVRMLERAFKDTGVRLLSTHEGGRKTFTNQFIDVAISSGIDYYQALVTVSKTLGHQSTKTTEEAYAQAKLLPKDKHLNILNQMAGNPKKSA